MNWTWSRPLRLRLHENVPMSRQKLKKRRNQLRLRLISKTFHIFMEKLRERMQRKNFKENLRAHSLRGLFGILGISFLIRFTRCVFRIKSNKTGDGKTGYVLVFVSVTKIMHCIIQMEDGMFWINKTKYPSFPALVDGYMNKKKGDDYYLLTGLNNRDLPICDDDKMTLSKTSSRNQPRSLPWYHGKLSNKVKSKYLCFLPRLSSQVDRH